MSEDGQREPTSDSTRSRKAMAKPQVMPAHAALDSVCRLVSEFGQPLVPQHQVGAAGHPEADHRRRAPHPWHAGLKAPLPVTLGSKNQPAAQSSLGNARRCAGGDAGAEGYAIAGNPGCVFTGLIGLMWSEAGQSRVNRRMTRRPSSLHRGRKTIACARWRCSAGVFL
jgi:hypothetical protein